MQSREVRLKNIAHLMGFTAWIVGCVGFIMYRLKSDNLETLEKEAEERIRINRAIKEMNQGNPKNK